RADAGHEAELHAPAQHLVDDGDLLDQPQRMVERYDVAHRADAHALGARAGANRIETRRGDPAFVRPEVMLDAEREVVAELVAQLQCAPQFLVALVRGHAGLGPDVREVRELHCGLPATARDKTRPERMASGAVRGQRPRALAASHATRKSAPTKSV